jgi:hypothetical protein
MTWKNHLGYSLYSSWKLKYSEPPQNRFPSGEQKNEWDERKDREEGYRG